MFLVTANKPKRLLYLNYVGQVQPHELSEARADLNAFLAELPPDLRVLADFSQLVSMDPECAPELGRAMDLLAQHGVSLIVRVMPDPTKDIGLNILTIFHYPRHPRVITCENLAAALRKLNG